MTTEFQPTYVRLPRDLHDAVKARAAAEERTMAQLIRFALRHYLRTTTGPGPHVLDMPVIHYVEGGSITTQPKVVVHPDGTVESTAD